SPKLRMGKCFNCGREAQLYVRGIPICVACDDEREERQREGIAPGEHHRISCVLKEDLVQAKKQLTAASTEFAAVMRDTPSGLPHPDGTQRIQNASRAYARARENMMNAIRRLNAFTIQGT